MPYFKVFHIGVIVAFYDQEANKKVQAAMARGQEVLAPAVGGLVVASEIGSVTIRVKSGYEVRYHTEDGERWFTDDLAGADGVPYFPWVVEAPQIN